MPASETISAAATKWKLPKHIPSLDGLRAISVLLVLAGHGSAYGPGTPKWHLFSSLFLNANLGVDWFFVISGFLITMLLIREQEDSGGISLSNFYIRRSLRILPPFYMLIVFVFLLKEFAGLAIPFQRIWTSATFTYNVIKHPAWGSWWLGHSWSLCVEEQFYLCWPLLLVFLGMRRARVAAIVLILAAPAIRIGLFLRFPQAADQIAALLPSRMDALMLGALASLCGTTPMFHRLVAKVHMGIVCMFAAFVFVVSPLLTYSLGNLYWFSFGMTLESACLLVILLYAVYNSHSWLGRVLNMRVFTITGVMSYSIYLWQQLFMTPLNTTVSGRLGINFLFIGLFAFASYRLIERPSLRARRFFESRNIGYRRRGQVNSSIGRFEACPKTTEPT
jgi:peptidoglycan/LPS O-acetylase OafA/YrhL